MLDPRFCVIPSCVKLDQGETFFIKAYAEAGEYKLITWAVSDGDEERTGEVLYNGPAEIGCTGGQLGLFAPSTGGPSQISNQSPMDLVDPSIGIYGLPTSIAQSLRDPKNKVTLKL
ncbi:MAG TPA: hypothetical protein V6D29_11680 [Leptolyngbyaceae cyanobacterium]